jgi:type VI secretion system secreted protein Hcp
MVGQKSGKIQGSVTQKGREGTSAVIAMSHAVASPRDAVTGLPSGKRQHKALTVTKELDRASTALRQALTSNEILTTVDLLFYRADRTIGSEVQYFTIRLTNATIAAIEMAMPNNKHADLTSLETFEDVSFTYQKIEWTWLENNAMAADDWQAEIA